MNTNEHRFFSSFNFIEKDVEMPVMANSRTNNHKSAQYYNVYLWSDFNNSKLYRKLKMCFILGKMNRFIIEWYKIMIYWYPAKWFKF